HIIGVEKKKKKTDLRVFAGARVSHIIGVENKKKKKKKTDLRIFAGARVLFLIVNICLVGMAPIQYPLASD
ncbi:hypothetical protein HID58_076251, partial [Brassica napus]